jgi:hypothetical protein
MNIVRWEPSSTTSRHGFRDQSDVPRAGCDCTLFEAATRVSQAHHASCNLVLAAIGRIPLFGAVLFARVGPVRYAAGNIVLNTFCEKRSLE